MNKNLFKTQPGALVPATDAVNDAGGRSYAMTPEHALVQMAVTGTFGDTFYTKAETQLDCILDLCQAVTPEYIAQVAIYAHEKGFMKDTPAILLAVLASRSGDLFSRVFDRIIHNGKALRNLTQVLRSGITGRKSLGSLPKRKIADWLNAVNDYKFIRATEGNAPSLADVIKMVHPKPATDSRAAMFRWAIGKEKEGDLELYPQSIADYRQFLKTPAETHILPDVPFLMLVGQPITKAQKWDMVTKMTWSQLRQNLNYIVREELVTDPANAKLIAERLKDRDAIIKARAFPFQLFNTWIAVRANVPMCINLALQDAIEISLENTPVFAEKKLVVILDVSGSMKNPTTGGRGTATSTVRNIEVASLFMAALQRVNPEASLLLFDSRVSKCELNPRDSVVTNTQLLTEACQGGSTNCAAPISAMEHHGIESDLAIMISDNESWLQADPNNSRCGTEMQQWWNRYKVKFPKAKLVCWDISPNVTTQCTNLNDTLNIGGFGDSVFDIIERFSNEKLKPDVWVNEVKSITV